MSAQIVVVDNDSGSRGPDREALRRAGVELIANAENIGYARAVNQGISRRGRASSWW